MRELLSSPAFSLAITLGFYAGAKALYARYRLFFLNPVMISILAIIAVLMIFGIDYDTFNKGGSFITLLLGPSVVALGYPLFEQLEEIRKRALPIFVSITVGSTVGIAVSALSASLLGASHEVALSLAPKSATTPIAIGIAEKIGAAAPLTTSFVIITGVVGAVLGPLVLKLIRVTSPVAFGLAMGAAAHGIGTARAAEEGELHGAASGLAICLNGIATAVLTPLLVRIMMYFHLL